MKRSFAGWHSQCAAIAIVAGIALATGALAHSEDTTLYVSETGSDQSDCRKAEQPCRSIEHALVNARKGDTIKVAAGRHTFRPDEPEEGIQLVGWVVNIKGGYDAAQDFAEPARDGDPTIITGPAPKFRARLEERNLILPKTEGRAQAALQIAQAQPEREPSDTAGDVLFVSEAGVDRGECTDAAAPCATLVYALSVAASGDRIAVAQGAFLLSQETLESARERNITIEGGYSTENQFVARSLTAAPSFVIGASFEERERLLEQGLILVQDSKAFDILAAPAGESAAGTAAAKCINGSAGGYPCKGLDLLARIPLSAFSSNPSGANDVWGFVDKNDNREYAIIGLRNGTAVIDVTDPVNPVEVGTIAGLQTIWRDIKVYQFFDSAANRWKAYAYVTADAVNQGFQIIDLTGLPGSISIAATVNAFASAHNIYMANIDYASGVPLPGQKPFAYVLGSNLQNGAFRILDLTNPVAPTLATTPPAGTGYAHDATSMLITDSRASQCQPGHNPCELLIDYNETTIDFWDVTAKAAPFKLSSITYPNAEYTHSGWWSKDKRYVLVQDELDEQRKGLNTRVVIIDLADLTNPVVAGTWSGPTKAIDHNGFTLGDEYYISNYRRGLTVLDVANHTAPHEKYFFDTFLLPAENDAAFNGAWGTYPYLPSGTILVSDIEGGLFLLKKSSAAPEPVPDGTMAFAWANQPTAPSYGPHATYAYNSKGPITVTRGGVGTYTVRFSGFGGNGKAGGHVQVTAYGPQITTCKIIAWSSSAADFLARVLCINAAGTPIDERFSILVEWPR